MKLLKNISFSFQKPISADELSVNAFVIQLHKLKVQVVFGFLPRRQQEKLNRFQDWNKVEMNIEWFAYQNCTKLKVCKFWEQKISTSDGQEERVSRYALKLGLMSVTGGWHFAMFRPHCKRRVIVSCVSWALSFTILWNSVIVSLNTGGVSFFQISATFPTSAPWSIVSII